MYGFRKVKEADRQYYVHAMFVRDKPHLVQTISRKPEKKLLVDSQRTREKQTPQPENDVVQPQTPPAPVRFKKRLKHVNINQEGCILADQHKLDSNSSLANIMNKSQATIFHHYDNDDKLSLCQNLEQKQNIGEWNGRKESRNLLGRSTKTTKIFWSPSVIIDDEDM